MARSSAVLAAVLILGIAIGVVIGAAGVPALRAQPARRPAYVVAEFHVTDPAGFTAYARAVPATLAPYHAKVLARGLPDMREGAPAEGQVVIIGFDSLLDADRSYDTPPYSDLIALRRKSAAARVYLVDGLPQ
jgi:uncharacterized protein (DUF1330 family)